MPDPSAAPPPPPPSNIATTTTTNSNNNSNNDHQRTSDERIAQLCSLMSHKDKLMRELYHLEASAEKPEQPSVPLPSSQPSASTTGAVATTTTSATNATPHTSSSPTISPGKHTSHSPNPSDPQWKRLQADYEVKIPFPLPSAQDPQPTQEPQTSQSDSARPVLSAEERQAERLRKLPPIERPVTRHFTDKSRSASISSISPSGLSPFLPAKALSPVPHPSIAPQASSSSHSHSLPPLSSPSTSRSVTAPSVKKLRRQVEPLSSALPQTSYDLYALQQRFDRQPLAPLLQQAPKSILTDMWQHAHTEVAASRALKRIEQVKMEQRWSLKQPKRFQAPARLKTQRDFLLEEMRWMALDYRQERKWKIAMAYIVGREVLQWHASRKQNKTLGSPDSSLLFMTTVDKEQIPEEQVYQVVADPDPKEAKYRDPIESLPITIMSRLATKRLVFNDANEQDRKRQRMEMSVPLLPEDRSYLPAVDKAVSAFYSPENVEVKSNYPPGPVAPINHKVRPSVAWSSEEEELLTQHARLSSCNWSYVADVLRTKGIDKSSIKTPWDCMNRFESLKSSSTSSSSATAKNASAASTSASATASVGTSVAGKSVKNRREEAKRRATRYMHFLDGLARLVKKRNAQTAKAAQAALPKEDKKEKDKDKDKDNKEKDKEKHKEQEKEKSKEGDEASEKDKEGLDGKDAGSSAPSLPPPKPKVNLNAHVSHQAIATRAGVDPRIYRGPLELNERRYKMLKMAESAKTPLALMQSQPPPPLTPGFGARPGGPSVPNGRPAAGPISGTSSLPSAAGAGSPLGMSPTSGPRGTSTGMPMRPPAPAAGGATPSNLANNVPITPQQMQAFLQRQNMLRHSSVGGTANGLTAGSPTLPGQDLTPAQLSQMPPAVAQRILMARQQAYLQQQQQQQMQQMQNGQSGMMRLQSSAGVSPGMNGGGLPRVPNPSVSSLPTQMSPEMMAAVEEAKKTQAQLTASLQQQPLSPQQQQQQQQTAVAVAPTKSSSSAQKQTKNPTGTTSAVLSPVKTSAGTAASKPSPISTAAASPAVGSSKSESNRVAASPKPQKSPRAGSSRAAANANANAISPANATPSSAPLPTVTPATKNKAGGTRSTRGQAAAASTTTSLNANANAKTPTSTRTRTTRSRAAAVVTSSTTRTATTTTTTTSTRRVTRRNAAAKSRISSSSSSEDVEEDEDEEEDDDDEDAEEEEEPSTEESDSE